MKFPRFFVDRPIFAVVLSVLMLIAGGLALLRLPLSEYPAVTPPTVQVTALYPGANPKVIAETVAAPLEQAINGVEGMLYMSSQAALDGRMQITISFQQGTDPDLAQVKVQNRVSRALPRCHDPKNVAGRSDGRSLGLPQRALRPALSIELCDAARSR